MRSIVAGLLVALLLLSGTGVVSAHHPKPEPKPARTIDHSPLAWWVVLRTQSMDLLDGPFSLKQVCRGVARAKNERAGGDRYTCVQRRD